MTAGAVGVLAVFCEFLTDGEMILGGVLVQGRHIVGWRRRRIVEYNFNHPSAACDGVGTVCTVVHAKYGSASDHAAIPRVFCRHTDELVASNLAANLVVEPPVHLGLGVIGIARFGQLIQGPLSLI